MATAQISKPSRWDVPFGNMTDEDVDRLLSISPFSQIDEDAFPPSLPLRGILKNDTRILRYQDGDIVVREGDYGNSAFFILSGTATVVLNSLPKTWLGHKPPERKSFFSALAQLWSNPKGPEVRNPLKYKKQKEVAHREQEEESGDAVRVYLQDIPHILSNYNHVSMDTGQFFGELAALSRTPRSATVFAQGNAEMLEIRWQGLRDIRQRATQIKEHIDRIYRERGLLSELRENPIFQHLDKEKLQQVADQTSFETFGQFDWFGSYKKLVTKSAAERLKDEPMIAEEGNYTNGLVVIRNGFTRVSQAFGSGHRTSSYLGRGQTYGLEEIVYNWKNSSQIPLRYSLRAVGYVDVLIIPTAVMENLVFPNMPQEQLALLTQPIESQSRRAVSLSQMKQSREAIGSDFLEFLVEHRYINGTAAMLIDQDRCVRCDDCVRACAAAHDNNPRFLRHGRTYGNYMVANACMHCVDPVCMIGCPTGAIHREPKGQVVINDNTCIGCATCANSCPYNNIRMVQIQSEDQEWILDHEERPVIKATKCDLCIDQLGGPACQRACPHDALKRIDLFDKRSLAKWMNRR